GARRALPRGHELVHASPSRAAPPDGPPLLLPRGSSATPGPTRPERSSPPGRRALAPLPPRRLLDRRRGESHATPRRARSPRPPNDPSAMTATPHDALFKAVF